MKKSLLLSKRILSAAAALVIALSACACGEKDNTAKENGVTAKAPASGTAGTSGSSGASSTPKTEAAAEDKTEAADGAEAEGEAATGDAAVDDADLSKSFGATDDIACGIMGDVAEPSMEVAPGVFTENGVDEVTPMANLLTAGEWNDNDNWGFFTNLINSGTITFPAFGIDPTNRTAVHVTDKDGQPVANASANLVADGDMVLWSAVTDKEGNAYLFAPSGEYGKLEVKISADGAEQTAEVTSTADEQGGQAKADTPMEITLDGKTDLYKNTEIMFIVDATGSMADEMLFLQSEFSAIAEEVGTDGTKYSVNFYRDEGDEYVTKCNPFTDDISKIQSLLNSESADGGGDTPEAVAQILDETITNGSWSEDSVKLAFLIFDAPPHSETEDTLKTAVSEAARKGIRLIPVVSSNADRDTELFARAVSICTGGTYVFLTDDSGIGDSHLEPIIGDYEVEKLYDIIIRVINDYRQ